MAKRLYFAYGSNINLEQMAARCPAAQVVGPAVLDGYELLFRGNRRGTGVATIEPLLGSQVHGLLWELWRDPAIPSPAYYGGILEGYRQNGLPVPELEAALKNVHDEVRQARHFERMQEMNLFSGEKPGRKKDHHER